MNPYLSLDRTQWSELRNSAPLTLTEADLLALQGINENLSMQEAVEIYLPLSRLLTLYVSAHKRRSSIIEQFLNRQESPSPFIIGVAGSVAVGKSTTARLLEALLSRSNQELNVDLVTTDGFLHSNKTLSDQDIMHKKGFPESYDMKRLVQFVADVKSGAEKVVAPVYSHLSYDITDEVKVVERPDILIIEGLNVLQSGMNYPHDPHRVFISDFLDLSLYVDADKNVIKKWYIDRFMKFRRGAFKKESSYFHHYTKLSEKEAIDKAESIWLSINEKNLIDNILPTRERANLILCKGKDHSVKSVKLRK